MGGKEREGLTIFVCGVSETCLMDVSFFQEHVNRGIGRHTWDSDYGDVHCQKGCNDGAVGIYEILHFVIRVTGSIHTLRRERKFR